MGGNKAVETFNFLMRHVRTAGRVPFIPFMTAQYRSKRIDFSLLLLAFEDGISKFDI